MIEKIISLKTALAFVSAVPTGMEKRLASYINALDHDLSCVVGIDDNLWNNTLREKVIALLLAQTTDNTIPTLAPLPVNPGLCARVTGELDDIISRVRGHLLTVQEIIIKRAPNKKKYSTTVRRQALDTALKSLEVLRQDPALSESETRRVDLLLGEAYYRRGCLVQPRGFSYPSKKKEALEKGLGFLAGYQDDQNAQKTNALIYLELAAMGEQVDTCKALENFTSLYNLETALEKNPSREIVLLALAWAQCLRQQGEHDRVDSLLESLVLDEESTPAAMAIDRARACWLCNLLDDELAEYISQAIDDLQNRPFSRLEWDEVRKLLVRVSDPADATDQWQDQWKGLAIKAWEVCREKEQVPSITAHIRWYWSRQADIYELAFRAYEGQPDKQAEVVDSLKGRPALHLQAGGAEMARQDDDVLGNRFIFNLIHPVQTEIISVPWPETPDPWIVVHLYIGTPLYSGENAQGHALIHTWEAGNRVWKYRNFPVNKLWQCFWTWQENYQLAKREAAATLEDLCLQIGHDMPFLFQDDLFPADRPVLFIPHDFLHRLPLHGALRDDKDLPLSEQRQVWAINRSYSYLPAWWMASAEKKQASGGDVVLDNWENDQFEDFGFAVAERAPNNLYKRPAQGTDLTGLDSPDRLYIFCHGKAHVENPYKACLELGRDSITHLEIREADTLQLAGTRVILGACETDLAPPLSTTVDEHLPLASAFLARDALVVISTMWAVLAGKVLGLVRQLDQVTVQEWSRKLFEWQTRGLQDYQGSNDPVRGCDNQILYYYISFRPYGILELPDDEENQYG